MVYRKGDIVKDPMIYISLVPKNVLGWGVMKSIVCGGERWVGHKI